MARVSELFAGIPISRADLFSAISTGPIDPVAQVAQSRAQAATAVSAVAEIDTPKVAGTVKNFTQEIAASLSGNASAVEGPSFVARSFASVESSTGVSGPIVFIGLGAVALVVILKVFKG